MRTAQILAVILGRTSGSGKELLSVGGLHGPRATLSVALRALVFGVSSFKLAFKWLRPPPVGGGKLPIVCLTGQSLVFLLILIYNTILKLFLFYYEVFYYFIACFSKWLLSSLLPLLVPVTGVLLRVRRNCVYIFVFPAIFF